MKIGWLILMFSMLADVYACVMAKQLDGLKRPFLLIAVVGAYMLSMTLFMYCMKVLPMGPAFAIWAGMGMVLVAVLSIFMYGQVLDSPAVIGMVLIVMGTAIMSSMSKMQLH